jgi:beta-lactamase superfamily II metal-dependent hydrolase
MMRRAFISAVWIVCACLTAGAAARAAKPLEIYFIDVEGGQSTLVVDSQGESLLIDTGWDDFNGRDANRIVDAAKAAGIDHIDWLVITHYHTDHAGGVVQLASRMKILNFADHGANRENSRETRANFVAYEKVAAQGNHIVVKPGDTIPFKGMSVQVLTSAGDEIREPLAGAGQANPLCSSGREAPVDNSENSRSVGLLITYGTFRFIDLGDLTTRGELGLACPNNLIGTVDLYLVTHHGTAHPGTGDSSNARDIVDALHPRVAVMDNGAIKGGHPSTWQTVHDSPGLEDLWQLHYAVMAGKDHNSPEQFIANLAGPQDAGHYIEASAEPDATFTVVNSRNNFRKTYKK